MTEWYGLSNHRLNAIWRQMRQRCNNPSDQAYKRYGGRGIKVCQEWEDHFLNFYNWAISNGYEEGLTIERLDVNKGYEPGNCEWITRSENARRAHLGKSTTKGMGVKYTFNGKSLTIAQWSEELGLNDKTIRNRLSRGWDVERALTTPKRDKR